MSEDIERILREQVKWQKYIHKFMNEAIGDLLLPAVDVRELQRRVRLPQNDSESISLDAMQLTLVDSLVDLLGTWEDWRQNTKDYQPVSDLKSGSHFTVPNEGDTVFIRLDDAEGTGGFIPVLNCNTWRVREMRGEHLVHWEG